MLMTCLRWCCLLAAIVLFSSVGLADPASDKFDQGVKALKNRDYDEAIACFDDGHPAEADLEQLLLYAGPALFANETARGEVVEEGPRIPGFLQGQAGEGSVTAQVVRAGQTVSGPISAHHENLHAM